MFVIRTRPVPLELRWRVFTARYELGLLNKIDYVSSLKGPTTVTAHYGDKLRPIGEKKAVRRKTQSQGTRPEYSLRTGYLV